MNNEALDFDLIANTTRYRSRLENLFHHAFDVMGLRRNLKEVTFMADFCTAITESLNCDDVLVAAARRFYDYVPFTLIVFSDLPEMRGRTTAFFPGETAKHADCVKKFIESFPGLELENIKDYVSLGFSSSRYSGMKGRPTILELPAKGGKITLLSETDVKSQFSGAVMNRILENFSLAWQNAVKYEKVKEDSLRDSLTGLYNRRVLEEMLILEDRKRGVNPLSLLLIDLDNFKVINDTYGHPAGDLALQCAARVLSDNARGSDLVVRNGGEEGNLWRGKFSATLGTTGEGGGGGALTA